MRQLPALLHSTVITAAFLRLNGLFPDRATEVILIDDAREFGVDPAYPTIEELRQMVAAQRPHLRLSVDADIIRIHPA